jgi:2-methylisocitrate lyase-like PEP mutase family enzyme
MSRQIVKASAFRALHTVGDPIILFNAWDAGSARAIATAGAKAIATGSWSVATAHGSDDGEQLPLELVLANIARIANTVDLPISLDFERGYGETPDDVGRSVAAAIGAGAIGFNIEDSAAGGLRAAVDQGERLAAARAAAGHSAIDQGSTHAAPGRALRHVELHPVERPHRQEAGEDADCNSGRPNGLPGIVPGRPSAFVATTGP